MLNLLRNNNRISSYDVSLFLFMTLTALFLQACPRNEGPTTFPPSSLRVIYADNPVIAPSGKNPIDGGDVVVVGWAQANTLSPDMRAYTAQHQSAGWFDTNDVDATGAGQTSLLRVAGTSGGGEIAVWCRTTSEGNRIYANRLANLNYGARWETPQALTGSVDVLDVAVASNTKGEAIAVWVQSGSPYNQLFARRYTPDIGWYVAQIIDDSTGNSELPRIALDDSGNAIALWQHVTASSTSIYTNYFSIAAGWGTPQLLSSSTTTASNPDLAMNRDGIAMAVWQQNDNGTFNAYARHFVPNTGWETAQLIESGSPNATSVHVAIDNTGSAVAVWRQPDIFFNRFTPSSGWGSEEAISQGQVDNPCIATNGNGKTIVSWNQLNPSSLFPSDVLIYSRKFDPTAGWEAAKNLSSERGSANRPNAAIDSEGNATIIWSQSVVSNTSGTTTAIFSSSY